MVIGLYVLLHDLVKTYWLLMLLTHLKLFPSERSWLPKHAVFPSFISHQQAEHMAQHIETCTSRCAGNSEACVTCPPDSTGSRPGVRKPGASYGSRAEGPRLETHIHRRRSAALAANYWEGLRTAFGKFPSERCRSERLNNILVCLSHRLCSLLLAWPQHTA